MQKLLSVIVLCIPLFLCGAEKIRLHPGKTLELKEVGVRLKPFRETPPVPCPTPDETTLTSSKGDRVTAFDIREWWIRKQAASNFSGQKITITVYRPKWLPPTGLKPLYENFHTEKAILECVSKKKSSFTGKPARLAWLKYHAGQAIAESADLSAKIRNGNDFTDYYASFPPMENTSWIVIVCRVPNGSEQSRIEKSLKSMLGTVETFAPSGNITPEKNTLSSANNAQKHSAAYESSRQSVVESIRSTPGWWFLETNHFIMAANLKKKKDIRLIRDDAERIRSLYETVMPAKREIEAISVIRVFDDREKYKSYLEGEYEWSSGLWMASKKELAFFIDYDQRRKDRTDQTKSVLYHELFHQYCFYATGESYAAVWFNEGMAQFWQNIQFKPGNKAAVVFPKNLNLQVQKALSTGFGSVRRIISHDLEEFQKNYEYTYPASQALMFYLLKGAPLKPETARYAQIPVRYFNTLSATRSLEKAYRAAWADVDLEKLDRDFHAFWTDKLYVKAVNNTKLPDFSERKKN